MRIDGPGRLMQRSPLPMSPGDVLVGFPYGHVTLPGRFASDKSGSPRQAVEQVVLEAVARPPCVVGFSGGRDSSVVLAVAAAVARREGLPEPVPVTRVFAGVPQADETEWQELVIRHLGITEWIREAITDEMDVVGPLASERLKRHGVLWSPLLHGDQFFLRHARGGSVLDGEGGDDVCDPWPHRIAPLANMLRRRRRPTRHRAVVAMSVLAPARLRPMRMAARLNRDLRPWLRPAAYEILAERWRSEAVADPLDARRSIMSVLQRRSIVDLQRHREYFASQQDTRLVSPLLDPLVAEVVAKHAGRLGYRDRADSLSMICGDLLPSEVLARWTKAEFNATFFNRYSREFAETWSGEGVDHELIDAGELKALWRGPEDNALSACLLQSAWLATRKDEP